MGEKLLEGIQKEIDQEQRERKLDCQKERVEFVNAGCYCSDHHDHDAFILVKDYP